MNAQEWDIGMVLVPQDLWKKFTSERQVWRVGEAYQVGQEAGGTHWPIHHPPVLHLLHHLLVLLLLILLLILLHLVVIYIEHKSRSDHTKVPKVVLEFSQICIDAGIEWTHVCSERVCNTVTYFIIYSLSNF